MVVFNKFKELQKYLIPDIVNLVESFINAPMENFDDVEFVTNCINTGDYNYHTKDQSLITYLYYNRAVDIIKMLGNSKYLDGNHFQNRYNYGLTDLHILCQLQMHNS